MLRPRRREKNVTWGRRESIAREEKKGTVGHGPRRLVNYSRCAGPGICVDPTRAACPAEGSAGVPFPSVYQLKSAHNFKIYLWIQKLLVISKNKSRKHKKNKQKKNAENHRSRKVLGPYEKRKRSLAKWTSSIVTSGPLQVRIDHHASTYPGMTDRIPLPTCRRAMKRAPLVPPAHDLGRPWCGEGRP